MSHMLSVSLLFLHSLLASRCFRGQAKHHAMILLGEREIPGSISQNRITWSDVKATKLLWDFYFLPVHRYKLLRIFLHGIRPTIWISIPQSSRPRKLLIPRPQVSEINPGLWSSSISFRSTCQHIVDGGLLIGVPLYMYFPSAVYTSNLGLMSEIHGYDEKLRRVKKKT